MSTTSPMTEATVTRVLQGVVAAGRGWWGRNDAAAGVAPETLAPLPDVQEGAGDSAAARVPDFRGDAGESDAGDDGAGVLAGCAGREWQKEKKLRVGRRVMVYLKTTSTNDVAWQCAWRGSEDVDGLVVLADEQTAGRGAAGASLGGEGGAVGVDVGAAAECGGDASGGGDTLTLLAGTGGGKGAGVVVGGGGAASQIKWPNDILHEGAEGSGDIGGASRGRRAGLIGIGVNVNQAGGEAGDFSGGAGGAGGVAVAGGHRWGR